MITVLRPKSISRIRQTKLGAREQLRAVGNILNQMNIELSIPALPLRPVDPACEARVTYDHRSYIVNRSTGQADWATVVEDRKVRVTFCPDEGSTLFAAYQYLLHHNALVCLLRDELHLSYKQVFQQTWSARADIARRRHKLQTHYLKIMNATPATRSFFSQHICKCASCMLPHVACL